MRHFIVILTILTFTYFSLHAQTTWDGGAGSSNWSDAANWNPDGVPTSSDTVVLDEGVAIIVDANAECASIIWSDNSVSSSLTINAGITLDVNGVITFSRPLVNGFTQTLDVLDGNLIADGIVMVNTGNNNRDTYVDIENGTIDINGNIIMTNGNRNRVRVRNNGSATINVSGDFYGGNFERGQSQVHYDGTSDQIVGNYYYYNLRVSNGGVKSMRGYTLVYGQLSVDNILSLNNQQLRVTTSGTIATNVVYGTTAMIDFSNGGFLRRDGNDPTDYETTYPIGLNGNYTPLVISSIAGSIGNGNMQIRLYNSKHGLTFGSDNAITRYWDISTTNITPTNVTGYFAYVDSDIPVAATEANFNSVGRLSSSGWQVNEAGTGYDHAANRITLSGAVPSLNGSWTLGESTGCFDGVLPDKYTISDGNWSSGSIWNGGTVPAPTDNVTVLHTVRLNINFSINRLKVTSGASFNLSSRSITVASTSDVYGIMYDNNNGGTNTFSGKLTIHPGGSYTTGNRSAHIFENGITNNGTFEINYATVAVAFNTNDQVIDGSEAAVLDGYITIASGLTLTNRVSEPTTGLILDGTMNGADGTSRFVTETLLSVRDGNGPMRTTGVFDASSAGNIVYYDWTNNQNVSGGIYHHLVATDGTNRSKTFYGDVTVNGDLTINTGTYFDPMSYNLTVLGNTRIEGTFDDDNTGGTTNLQDVDLSGGVINGGNNGVVNINGTLTMPTANASIGRVDLNVVGQTTIPSGIQLQLNNANGTKSFGDIVVDGTWDNTSNESITIRGNLTTNASSIFNADNGTYYFTGTSKTLDGALAALGFYNVDITGSLTNTKANLTVYNNLTGAGSLTLEPNTKLYIFDDNSTLGTLNASANGCIVEYGSGGTQYLLTNDYYNLIAGGAGNKRLNDDFDILGDLTVNSILDLRLVADTITVSGNATIDGTLIFNGTTTKVVSINGDLSGSGNINMTGGNLLHRLNLGGALNSLGSLSTSAVASIIDYNRTGDQQIIALNNYRELRLSGTGNKNLVGDISVGNDLLIQAGNLNTNSNTITTSQNVTIDAGASLYLDNNSSLLVSNNRTVTNNGLFRALGASGNPATMAINGTGNYYFTQPGASAEIAASFYAFNDLNDGLNISGGSINVTNNLNDGSFSNGIGQQSINITGIDVSLLPNIANVVFNTGPTYNVTRTSGTGMVTFLDGSGAIVGENFDNDNGNPGTLINWIYPSSTYYSRADGVSGGLPASWTRNPDGTGGSPANVTDGLSTFIVQDGHTVIVDNNGDINALSIQVGEGTSGTLRIGSDATQRSVTVQELLEVKAGATLNAGSTGAPSHTLNIYGNIINDGTINLTPSASVVNTEFHATTSISGANLPIFNDINIKSGSVVTGNVSLDVDGNFTIEDGGEFNDGGLTHYLKKNFSVENTGALTATGTLEFNGTVNTITTNPSGASITFNNLTFNGSGVGSVQEDIIVNGDFQLINNRSLVASNISMTFNGNFTIEAGSDYSQTANYTYFNSTNNQTINLLGTASFYNLSFNNGAANPKSINGDLRVTNLTIISNGATVDGAGTHGFYNGLRVNGTCNFSGTVNMFGGYLQTYDASSAFTLGTAVLNIEGNISLYYAGAATGLTLTVNNDVNINNGYLVCNSNTQLTGQPGNTFNLNSNESLFLRGVDNFPTGFGTYNISEISFVRYDAGMDQTIRGGLKVGHILFTGSNTTKTIDGALDIEGNIYMYNSITLDMANYSHTFAGDRIYNRSNAVLDATNATFTFDADDAHQYVETSGTGSYRFNNLSFIQNGATATRIKEFASPATITVGNDFIAQNLGGSSSLRMEIELNTNGIQGPGNDFTLGEYCQITTDHTDFGTNAMDNFAGTITLDPNSTFYFRYNNQLIPDGFSYGNISLYSGNKTARGALDINGSISRTGGTPVFYDAGFTHNLAGDWLLNSTNYYTAASATGTIVFDGADQTINAVNFNNIEISNSGTVNVINHVNVFGNLTVNAGGKIDLSTRNLNIAGNMAMLGTGVFDQVSGTTTFNGTSNQTLTSNTVSNIGLIIINKPNPVGQQTVSVLSDLNVSGNITITEDAGILDITNQTVNFGGRLYVEPNIVEVGPTFISTGSTVYFDGNDAQYIQNANTNPLTFNNVMFSGGGDKTIDIDNDNGRNGNRAMQVDGDFTIDGSVLSASGWNDGGMDIYVRGDWSNTGTFQHNNNRTVYFDGNNDQNISSSGFWNLNIQGTDTKTLQGNISVYTHITLAAATFDANNFNITVDGNWDNSAAGAIFNPRTGTVVFNGGAANIMTGTSTGPTAGKGFYNVDFNKNGQRATLLGDLDVDNDLTITSGYFRTNQYDVWVGGNFNNEGTLEHNNNASVFTFDATSGIKTIDANGANFRGINVNAPGATYQMLSDLRFVYENFVLDNGTFVLNENKISIGASRDSIIINNGTLDIDTNSTIEFQNTNQAINLVSGTLKLVGSASKLATLTRSSGTFAVIQDGGTLHAQYYLVRNGNLTLNGGSIDATDNFSNGTFASGSGNAYLNLSGLNFADFTATNVSFNSGPTYNVSRTSGTGIITFMDASGSIAGENYDQDDADPGTLIEWIYPAGLLWDNDDGTDNWHDANNWSGNVVPTATDIVVLEHTYVTTPYTVNLSSASANVLRLTLDEQGNGNSIELVLSGGADLDIDEHVQINNNTTLTVTDNSNIISVGKNWSNLGTFNHGNSTILFDGPAGFYTLNTGGTAAGKSLYNVIINAEDATYNLGSASDIDNNFTVSDGTFKLASGAYDLTVGGDWFIDQSNGAVFDAATADVTFDGADQTITNGVFYNFLTAGSGTKTIASNIAVDIDLTIGANTTIDGLENNIYVTDDWINNGSFTQTGLGSVIFDGTGGQNIDNGTNPTDFHNITFMNRGGKTFFNNSNVTGELLINGGSGVVNVDTYIITGVGASNNLTNFGTLEIRGASNFPSGFENITLSNTSWVNYRADIDQEVFSTSYGNLRLRGNTVAPTTKTAAGDLIITGYIDMDDVDSTTFDVATNEAYITLTGTLRIRPDCDIIWGTGNSTIEHVGGNWYIDPDLDSLNHVILAGTGDKYTQGNLLIGGNVTVKTGVDLMMYTTSGRTNFRTMTGDPTKSFTLEQGARILNATPAATGPAIPEGFGTYTFDDNSSYYLYSPIGVDQTLFTGASYGNLYFREIKNVTSDGLGDLDVNGNFDMYTSTYFDNGSDMNLAGVYNYFTNYTPTDSTITVTLDGNQNQYLRDNRNNTILLPKFVATGSGIKSIGDGNDVVTIDGNFTVNSGSRAVSNRNITFNGYLWDVDGTYQHTGNSITFNGGVDQFINPGPSNPLTSYTAINFSNNSTKTLFDNGFDINGNVTINAGTVDLASLEHSISGSIYNTSGGTLTSNNANLILDGGTQYINTPAFEINNITTRNGGRKVMYSDWTINGDLTIESGTILDTDPDNNNTPPHYDIYIKGNWTSTGTYYDRAAKVIFNGATSPISITSNGSNFYDVEFAPTAPVTYSMVSPTTNIVNTLEIGTNATFDLNSTTLNLGRNSVGNTVTVDGTLLIDENATFNFDNRTAQCVMNVSGTLQLIGANQAEIAVLSRNSGTLNTQVNILSGGTLAANYYLIEYLDGSGMNMQAGSILDPVNNLSNGTWSNIPTAADSRYITLEANYTGDTIRNIAFNYIGTPTQGTQYNVWRQTATPDIVFDLITGNIGGYQYEKDEEVTPSPTSGKCQWPAITETNWTGAVNTDWHVDGNWDNGVPTLSIDAIVPDRANDPIISNADAVCKNLTIEDGTVELSNNRTLTTRGDVTIGTGSSVGLLVVNTANSEITVGGQWTRGTNGIFLHGNSTVIFNSGAGSATINPRNSDFYNVVINNSLTSFYLTGSTIRIRGKLDILAGTLSPSTNNYLYYIDGDIDFSGGTFFPRQGGVTTGTVVLSGADQSVTAGTFYNLTVAGSGNKTLIDSAQFDGRTRINTTLTANSGCNVEFNGDVTINAGGTFNDGDETHYFKGASWYGYGTYAGNGTMIFNANNRHQYIYEANFYNLDVNCANRNLYIRDSIDIGNNLSIRQDVNYVYIGTDIITNTSGLGIFTLEDGVRLSVRGTDNYPTGFGAYNLAPTSWSYYDASGDQTIKGITYGHLYLNNGGTKTLGGDTEVQGNLTFRTSTLDVSTNNYALSVAGHWYNNLSGNFICRNGEVTFNGTANNNQAILFNGPNLNEFYNLTISKASAYAYAGNNTTNDFTVNNNLSVTSGRFHANGRDIYIKGDMTATGTGTFYNNTGHFYLVKASGSSNLSTNGSTLRDVTINSSGGATYTLQDDFDIIGDFNLLAGTFDGNGKTVQLGNGNSDVINILGTYKVGAGGSLAIGYYTSLTVEPSGSIEIVGSPSGIARVTRRNNGRYNFTVNGNIAARYYMFEYMNNTGIYLSGTSTIDATNNFKDGTFSRGANSGQLFRVENTQSFQDPNYISNVTFPINPGGSASNVAKINATTGDLEFYNSSGLFAGESYDNDPSDKIHWTGPIILTWNGSVSTDWNDSLNWTASYGPPIVPTGNENVIIAAALNQPILTTFGQITASLTIENGASIYFNTPADAAEIDLDINGDLTIENGGALRLNTTNDYLNVEGSWTKQNSGTAIINGNVTFDGAGAAKTINNGIIPFYNLTIAGYSQYQLAANTIVNNNFVVADTSTFDVSTNDFSLTVKGGFTSLGNFMSQNGTVYLVATAGTRTVYNNTSFYNVNVNTPSATYQLGNNIGINRNLNIISGTLDANSRTLRVGDGNGLDYLTVTGNLIIDENATLSMGNNSQVNVNSGATLTMVGTDNSNRATVTGYNNGRYSFDINSGGTLAARFYQVEYTDVDGINLNPGASVNAINNLSDGLFNNGTAGGAYIKLRHEPATDDTIRNVIFNTGATFNVSRTSGTAVFFIQDATGTLGTYDYEQDIGSPDPASGLLEWPLVNTNIWMGVIDSDWHKAGNWSGGIVPDNTKNAVISAASINDPVISTATANAKTITIEPGISLTISQDLDIAENLIYEGSVIATGSPTITIAEEWIDNGGSFTPGNSTVEFITASGTKGIDITTGSFYNLSINAPGAGYLIYRDLTVSNNLSISNGDLDLNSNNINIAGGLAVSGTFTLGTSLVTFNGTSGSHLVDAPSVTFPNIVVNSSSGNARYMLNDNLSISNNLTITDGIFDLSPDGGTTSYNLTIGNRFTNSQGDLYARNGTIEIGENWINSVLGTIYPGTSTVEFVSASGTRSISSGNGSFYDLLINGNATFRLSGNLDVDNDITIQNGTLDLATGPSYNVIVGGNWDNSATFEPRAGQVSFDGVSQSITNASGEVFYNLEGNSSLLQLNNNVTVTNTFTLTSGIIDAQTFTLMLGTGVGNPGSLTYVSGGIIGKFERWMNAIETDYIFPVGTATTYNPATIRCVTNLTNGTVEGEFISTNPGTSGLPANDGATPIDDVFTEGFWRFVAKNGMASTDYNVTINGSGFTSQTLESSNRVLKRTNGSDWDFEGTHVSAVVPNVYRNTLNGIATSSTDFCIGIISCVGGTIGTADTVCEGIDLDPFTNITLPTGGGTYTYTWQESNTITAVPGDANWTDIPSSNTAALDYGIINDTTIFVRKEEAVGCPTTYSNTVIIHTIRVPQTGPMYHIRNQFAE